MRFVDIIEKKKNKLPLTKEELHYFIDGYVKNELPDYQVSALLMAICLNGMDEQETSMLTEEMLLSGDQIDLSMIDGIICDKHSTGGVGDKTSLSLLPMVAACGVKVAKMSGRGLGHTGGTLDKVESITGFTTTITMEAFISQVQNIGLAIIGQSERLVPADKLLYALRDVTATVNSIPLIASSIMSKKLACGSDAILLDVKYGEGAFMPTPEKAIELADTMIHIGKHFGKDVRAMITDMNEPLGNAIGNALEVKEAIDTLHGHGPKDFQQLCYEAGSIMLVQAGKAQTQSEAKQMLEAVVANGEAFQKLCSMVEAQGGDQQQIEDPKRLPRATQCIAIHSKKAGYLHDVHALKLGNLAMRLGAGRAVKTDVIDPATGILLCKKKGDIVQADDVIAYVHVNANPSDEWLEEFYQAFTIHEQKQAKKALIYQVLHD